MCCVCATATATVVHSSQHQHQREDRHTITIFIFYFRIVNLASPAPARGYVLCTRTSTGGIAHRQQRPPLRSHLISVPTLPSYRSAYCSATHTQLRPLPHPHRRFIIACLLLLQRYIHIPPLPLPHRRFIIACLLQRYTHIPPPSSSVHHCLLIAALHTQLPPLPHRRFIIAWAVCFMPPEPHIASTSALRRSASFLRSSRSCSFLRVQPILRCTFASACGVADGRRLLLNKMASLRRTPKH